MEYEVQVSSKNGEIVCDFAGAKDYLKKQLAEYEGVVFMEDSKTFAKATVADLRKQKKAFADRVKEVKTEYMRPFDNFKKQADELIEMFDTPINYINGQIEEMEAKRIEAKKQAIDEKFCEIFGEDSKDITLDKFYNPRWENATYTMAQVEEDMRSKRKEISDAVNLITAQAENGLDDALKDYLSDFNLTRVLTNLTEKKRLTEQIRAQEQERIQKETEERIRAEERARVEAELKAKQDAERLEAEKQAIIEQAKQDAEQAKAEAIEVFIPDDAGARASVFTYEITLTADAKAKLEMFMDSIGIEYEMMPF